MKILISCDMEGISGVVDWAHTEPDHGEYGIFRELMAADVNAAIRGTFDAGADEVLVADGHYYGRNILPTALDPRAQLYSGVDKPLAIVQGAEEGIDAAIFVGYHARIDTPNGLLCHTWSGNIAGLWLNDVPTGEIGLSAGVCGHYNSPVVMISGDDTACKEAHDTLGPLETAIVKRALGRQSALCMPIEAAQKLIYETAARAIQRLKVGDVPAPYRPAVPVKITLRFMRAGAVNRAALIPGTKVLDAFHIEYTAKDMLDTFSAFRAFDMLAND